MRKSVFKVKELSVIVFIMCVSALLITNVPVVLILNSSVGKCGLWGRSQNLHCFYEELQKSVSDATGDCQM